jgi:transposase InsO family protein
LDNGHSVETDVVKDRGSLRTLGLSVGSAATGDDVVLLLKTLQARKGGLPLMLQTDNGAAYCSNEVVRLLEQEQVVHLRSRVRQPTDNGAAERGIGELKAEAGLGRGKHIEHARQAGLLLASAADRLNRNRCRGSKGYRTANTLAKTLPSWYNRINRDRFYREAGEAIRRAEENNGKRRARHAANEAVLTLLERHGIVERTRGVQPNHGT